MTATGGGVKDKKFVFRGGEFVFRSNRRVDGFARGGKTNKRQSTAPRHRWYRATAGCRHPARPPLTTTAPRARETLKSVIWGLGGIEPPTSRKFDECCPGWTQGKDDIVRIPEARIIPLDQSPMTPLAAQRICNAVGCEIMPNKLNMNSYFNALHAKKSFFAHKSMGVRRTT